ncbi:MAG: peptidoglycan synthetase [Marinilabiliales bacterium]|nr:MAG: peptidoglycan synthetase [Marinilabiliales bacterium]
MRIHFIAIGGAVMHNLAIALKNKGYHVTGSDDEIFDPSRSRLERYGLLPEEFGWNTEKISHELDAVILGMHAREDNPELIKAKELGIKIYSFPEFVYEQTKEKTRVVIGGSHGKTTITSMIIHALQASGVDCDYLVGAQLEGFELTVKLSHKAQVVVIEGDEYLTSALDRRPKFHVYKPHVALISGIEWDHKNVFPTWDNYKSQFSKFIKTIESNGTLVFCQDDKEVDEVVKKDDTPITKIPYLMPDYSLAGNNTVIHYVGEDFPMQIFGRHNMLNLNGAALVCMQIGLSRKEFYRNMQSFSGASNRLEKIREEEDMVVFRDFAHAPSKVRATVAAVREQYPENNLIAVFELHTFSSLSADFLPFYKDTMNPASNALVYFNPDVLEHKRLAPLTKNQVKTAFGGGVEVVDSASEIADYIKEKKHGKCVLLLMSSGNFGGIVSSLIHS